MPKTSGGTLVEVDGRLRIAGPGDAARVVLAELIRTILPRIHHIRIVYIVYYTYMVLLSSGIGSAIMGLMAGNESQPKPRLVWERLQQTESGARLALTRDQIVRAAMAIADA